MALQRDLPVEAHLRALAFWYRVGAILIAVLGIGVVWLAGSLATGGPYHTTMFTPTSFIVRTAYMAMFIVAAAAGSWVLGHFLARFANGARLTAAILTLTSLALTGLQFVLTAIVYSRMSDAYNHAQVFYGARPSLVGPIAWLVIATIWMIAIAWTLFSSRAANVCTPAYRTIVARTAAMKAPMVKSPFFVIPLVATILALSMSLMLVARLHSGF
jgi:hypothetical protein